MTAHARSILPPWISYFMLAIGVLLMLVATDVIPSEEEKFHAPRWVLFVCGLLFASPGAASLLPFDRRTPRWLAAFMCLCFALVGGGVALYGEREGASGGLPFVSNEMNFQISRFVFGGSAFLCLILAIAIFRSRDKPIGDAHAPIVKDAEASQAREDA